MYAPNNAEPKTVAGELDYELLTTHVDDSGQMSYTTYGIRVRDAQGEVVLEHLDISTSNKYVQSFIEMVKGRDVSPVHVADILEDYLE